MIRVLKNSGLSVLIGLFLPVGPVINGADTDLPAKRVYEYAGEFGSERHDEGQIYGLSELTPGPAGEFLGPRAVAVSPTEDVYVTDWGNGRIQYFTPSGSCVGMWGRMGGKPGDFFKPTGIGVAPDGTVYVADQHRVQYFTASGSFLGSWGSEGSGEGEFERPEGLHVGADGTVYVADRGNNRVQYFTATGSYLGSWGPRITDALELNYPNDVVTGPDGKAYIVDDKRVVVLDGAGSFVRAWGTEGYGEGEFLGLEGVAVADDGVVFVTDTPNHRVQYFDSEGVFLGEWGEYGRGRVPGKFCLPFGIAVAASGVVYVVDATNNRVQYFRPKESRK